MKWSIDIETYRNDRAFDYTNSMKIPAPGNVKDPAKILAAIDKKRIDAAEKHALTWWTGKIISVALAYADKSECTDFPPVCFFSHNEKEILTLLDDYLNGIERIQLVGKNSKTFDFPYLVGRYMANDMVVPYALKQKDRLFDVDDFFGWSSASGQRGKLDAYLHGLGLPLKPMDGSMVGALYEKILSGEKEWKELTDYNVCDAVGTAKIAQLYWDEK